MTKLLFLGSGSAFTVGCDNFQSNMFLISDRGKKLLIDCGSDLRFSLHALGYSYLDITDIYISHLHADHVGGLEYVGFGTKFNPQCERPNIYTSKDIVYDLWDKSLSGGMRLIDGDIVDLESFFVVHKIGLEKEFYWEGIKFNLIKTVHIDSNYIVMPSYGLFFQVDGVKVLLTTDTKFTPDLLEDKYKEADIIFHDCEISAYPTPVHPHYKDLRTLPLEIKQKMWLYGYQPQTLPESEKDGFLGFVKRGDIFDLAKMGQQL